MFKFLKKDKNEADQAKRSWKARLSSGLRKTRQRLGDNLADVLLGKKDIDEDLFEALETALITADLGVETTQTILDELNQSVSRREVTDATALLNKLKSTLTHILTPCEKSLNIDAKPFVILMVGINGAGKTTSIAKLAHYYQAQQKKVVLAAGDTFRAAAVEQLQTWGERNKVPVIAQHSGADSASVIFDALAATTARDADLLIADTAGRLHTQTHLMEELKKIKRVMQKQNQAAPHEIILVLDASLGQNGLRQAKAFHQAVGVSGIILTKLDGTAKGGIIFAIADELGLPIRFIGVGEGIEDLQPFKAAQFVDALFEK